MGRTIRCGVQRGTRPLPHVADISCGYYAEPGEFAIVRQSATIRVTCVVVAEVWLVIEVRQC